MDGVLVSSSRPPSSSTSSYGAACAEPVFEDLSGDLLGEVLESTVLSIGDPVKSVGDSKVAAMTASGKDKREGKAGNPGLTARSRVLRLITC